MNAPSRHRARKLTTLPLIAATFFMVAGGSYGLEEMIAKTGFSTSILILLLVPLVWSLPTALMLAELSSALPAEGGFYVWVRRALGPFWGFQEAWLSLVASIFDMAIYPTIFVLYLAKLWPWAGEGGHGMMIGAALITACTLWNLRGARAVGDSSILFALALLSPFFVMTVLGLWKGHGSLVLAPDTNRHADLLGGILVGMWNFMGWDNASTVAGEVENPQRTYPLAMIGAVLLVTIDYALPVMAVSRTGIDASSWDTGSWVDAAAYIGGPWLGYGVIVGGMLCGAGMFNALIMSYSRLPMVLAEDGYLPKVFARRIESTQVPWVSVISCAVAWSVALGLNFERLIMIDVLLYGAALVLEFIALVALRILEPELPRPFRVPGGTVGAVLVGIVPTALIAIAFIKNRDEQIGGISALWLALFLIVLGPLLYGFAEWRKARSARLPVPQTDDAGI